MAQCPTTDSGLAVSRQHCLRACIHSMQAASALRVCHVSRWSPKLWYGCHRYMKYLVFPMYSFWVPQILYCAYHEARQPLRPLYVVGMTLTRLALPLYIFGCPYNVLRLQTDLGICALLCLSMAVQVIWGAARCLVPCRHVSMSGWHSLCWLLTAKELSYWHRIQIAHRAAQ